MPIFHRDDAIKARILHFPGEGLDLTEVMMGQLRDNPHSRSP
jgi:hypothetical protein